MQTEEGKQAQGNFLKEAAYGFKYIFDRPSLLGLQLIFFFGNLFAGISYTVIPPMILAKTNQNSLLFGTVQSAGAIGMVLGGVVMSAWGGFKRQTNGVLLGLDVLRVDRHSHPGVEFWIADLDRRDGAGWIIHAADQQFQPGHLAVQGGAGSAGAGIFSPAVDRLVCQPDLAHYWRHTG